MKNLFIFCLLAALFAGCTPVNTPLAATLPVTAVMPTKTLALSVTPSLTALPPTRDNLYPTPRDTFAPTPYRRPTISPIPSLMPTITPTARVIQPSTAFTPFLPQVIGADNIDRLTLSEYWGLGTPLLTAFSPDGQVVVVGSAVGLMLYDVAGLASGSDEGSRWLPFDFPFRYQSIEFSEDGDWVKLSTESISRYFNFSSGLFSSLHPDVTWKRQMDVEPAGWQKATAISPDGRLRFEGTVEMLMDERIGQYERSQARVLNENGQLLYEINDAPDVVTYSRSHEPEGCDLSSFSYCGNVYMPVAMGPFRAHFSSDGQVIAVLYRAYSMGFSSRFSVLRLYRASDGLRLASFGTDANPVADFALRPATHQLFVALTTGEVFLWDDEKKITRFTAQPMRPATRGFAFSPDGSYALILYDGLLEIRRTVDGILTESFSATAFSISPFNGQIALGTTDGTIRIIDLERGKVLKSIEGHTGKIYALAFSPDGKRLVSAAADCSVRLWDTDSGRFLRFLDPARVDAYMEQNTESRIFVYDFQFLSNGDVVGFGSWGAVARWDGRTGKLRYTVQPERLEYWSGMITLNPHFPGTYFIDEDKQSFYIGSVIYDLLSGEKKGEYVPQNQQPPFCMASGARTDDEKLLITIAFDRYEGRLCVLDARTQQLLSFISIDSSGTWANFEPALPFMSMDGGLLVLPGYDGTLLVYKVMP